ncbi:MAG: NAD(P)H-hydrate epimerase [Acidimicrobiia bacterium]|nr:NAD(P)H-hydrate epimerase [Acidimicrobiia bacterium]MBT8217812.1 NAD(P)H-hydrate epimerase [Acidimicrobiia bacterium]NNF08804.1 NAD(P)H-hydrate epimerase [Acidimicrobiia bacterium]NNL69113.1 NAD(P)H-hydrate epimerase [Acidimicrobiia bacterium]
MREVDRVMIEDLHIHLGQMMENAGSNLARLVLEGFAPASVEVLAGGGGNGGGGLVAARHLANQGVAVTVVLAKEHLSPVTAHQRDILGRMGVAVSRKPGGADLTIDALVGYSLSGNPRGRVAELIDYLNGGKVPVVSLDNPSGLDVTTGRAGNPCVSATATLTLAAPKVGLVGSAVVGDLFLADISVPPFVYGDRTMPPGVFAAGSVVRLA